MPSSPSKPKATLRPVGVPLGNVNSESEREEGNYPTENVDSTSSGGYGSSGVNVWSQKAQRGTNTDLGSSSSSGSGEAPVTGTGRTRRATVSKTMAQRQSVTGLVGQSLSGGDLAGEIQDAKQGFDGGWPSQVGERD
ncbi:hypothetical protein CC1G_04080 [Coprinopsis cinerea okayama7|uniref:Uncharacterized protein n=1 Tax=Coprinopsis cinerea (strain Okayama-7 / 130 / ATCC MYA-4618 / FGSC 9003) TaxID=240176 RepID=A8NVW3_COPC7|nr:hypothetical protein CC1G_04080 [Coprinopsis cinerea okayama7\|eukprot:XP_001836767.1 hypothetical protein CC1G_04080 [Coprinopsis cinerea okayama7\